VFRKNPKPFIGYSDHTSLHTWLQQECGLVTFYGPMVAADFAREGGVDAASWNSALLGPAKELSAVAGLRAMQAGTARGVLRGGCTSILAESLGTPYAFHTAEDTILFLEDVGHHPYQWDRQLLHLKYAGVLEQVRGIVFGDMAQCAATAEDAERMAAALCHGLRGFAGPVAIGLRSGHVYGGNITLPLGVQVELDVSGEGARLRFMEAAVGE
jgi:muramoyltetrapeptide carboxypeptidase